MRTSLFTILLITLLATINASARSYLVEPHWQTGKNDFREAYVDEQGTLTDYYLLQGSDTVNMIDVGAANYDLNISFELQNCHNEPFASYTQYYRDPEGNKREATARVKSPTYGWVWGMRDMQHYNAILLQSTGSDESIYNTFSVKYRIVTVNGNDTIYHTPWTSYNLKISLNDMNLLRFWLQYRNNTVWIGGENSDVPWTIQHNIPCFGPYTGLYLSSAAKVKVSNTIIAVQAKEVPIQTGLTRATLTNYFVSQPTDPVEGFWRIEPDELRSDELKMGGKYSLAIVANDDEYLIIYLSGAKIYPGKWQEGMIKGRLTPNSWGAYDLIWYDAEGGVIKDSSAQLRGNALILDFILYHTTLLMSKEPDNTDQAPLYGTSASGTGFAIHADGYVATNHHVIDGHNTIYIISTDKHFPSPLKATVVASDSINDLAILKITDKWFNGFGKLPYNISYENIKRGEEVYCMGYPISNLLGNEIKVSQGIISALNGIRASELMLSLDIDHGNSGSPVFDKKGNILGVISAMLNHYNYKITASMAVKSSYLLQLMKKVGIEPANAQLQKELSTTLLVDTIAPYVFLIECH